MSIYSTNQSRKQRSMKFALLWVMMFNNITRRASQDLSPTSLRVNFERQMKQKCENILTIVSFLRKMKHDLQHFSVQISTPKKYVNVPYRVFKSLVKSFSSQKSGMFERSGFQNITDAGAAIGSVWNIFRLRRDWSVNIEKNIENRDRGSLTLPYKCRLQIPVSFPLLETATSLLKLVKTELPPLKAHVYTSKWMQRLKTDSVMPDQHSVCL